MPATQISPGVVSHKEQEMLHIGTYPAVASPAFKASASAFFNLLTQCKASSKLYDDVQPQRWVKLLINTTWNPICALTRSRDKAFLDSDPEAEEFATAGSAPFWQPADEARSYPHQPAIHRPKA